MKSIINYKNLIKLIAVFILFYCSSLFQYIPIFIFNFDINQISNNTKILLSIFSNICVLLILIILYHKDLIKDIKKLKKKLLYTMDSSFKYYLFGVLGMIVSNIVIGLLLKDNGPNNEKLVQQMITISPILMFINAGLIAPIIEELVFRKSYMDTFKNKWLFVILSGFVFGLMHVITSSNSIYEYLYLIPYMSLGVSFAYMDFKHNNIFPSIFMHIFHNSILVILSVFI